MIELLLSLILALTGIPRDVDPSLTAIAEKRAIEVSSDWSHDGRVSWTAEVLAWNSGYPDLDASTRRAAEQWRGSPGHWAILIDPALSRIGCGHHQSGELHFFVCVFAFGPSTQVAPSSTPDHSPEPSLPSNPDAATVPEPDTIVLPDTAMETP